MKTTRQEILDTLRADPGVAVLIIGGGINGIGTFRDLALQGVDVLLVDKADFCAGASAGSSHMVHGGLRYLENGEFRLVREALTERNRLLQNAPHYVHPLPTTIPIFNWFSGMLNAPLKFIRLRDKPSNRGAIIIKMGLTMYDLFTRGQQTLPTHKFASRKKSLEQRPKLNPDIICTATYYDAWMPYPERICLELILDAEASTPDARALNYVSAIGGSGDEVTLRDELTGETVTVKPRIVVNAAGPWIDLANDQLGQRTKFIGGTKGSHLILDHPELRAATLGHEMFFENVDGRICLFFPLEDRVLVGTTDIPIDNPDDARCTDEEIDYMLAMVRHVFPEITLTRDHIVFYFTGVRPLPASDAATPGQISRDHSIRATEPDGRLNFPILSLVGGKWTTFRAFAEQVTDKLLDRLGQKRRASTAALPIGGGKNFPRTEAEQTRWAAVISEKTGVPQERLVVLLTRYGTRAEAIAQHIAAGQDAPLVHHPDYSRREIAFVAQQEKVLRLEDFLLRRSLLAMTGKVSAASLEEVAAVLADALGWTEDKTRAEVQRTVDLLHTHHGIALDLLTQAAASA